MGIQWAPCKKNMAFCKAAIQPRASRGDGTFVYPVLEYSAKPQNHANLDNGSRPGKLLCYGIQRVSNLLLEYRPVINIRKYIRPINNWSVSVSLRSKRHGVPNNQDHLPQGLRATRLLISEKRNPDFDLPG